MSAANQPSPDARIGGPRGRLLRSPAVLGAGYGLAALLTGVAILLAASPPSTGPLGPASDLILTVLGFNLILILALTLIVFLRFANLLEARERVQSSPLSALPSVARPWWWRCSTACWSAAGSIPGSRPG